MIDKNYRLYQSTDTGDWIVIKLINRSINLNKLKAKLMLKHKYNINVSFDSLKSIRGVQRGMRYHSANKTALDYMEDRFLSNNETYPQRQDAFFKQANICCVNWIDYLWFHYKKKGIDRIYFWYEHLKPHYDSLKE